MAEIIAGILEKDLAAIERKLALVTPYASWVQIDVMDNTLVPNETFHDIEKLAPIVRRYAAAGIGFEAHLMVAKPETYVKPLAEAGFTRIIAQVECDEPREFLAEARSFDVEVGLALDGDTDIDAVEPMLDEVDCLLVMTIDMGASGKDFRPETLSKVKDIRRNLPDLPIEVDGGINPETAKLAAEAGATRILSTSYIVRDPGHVADAFEELRMAAEHQSVFVGSSE